MSDKWTLYHQTGPDGQEWGVKIRPGYVVTGFTREDAEAVVAWQNASCRPASDILERAKEAASIEYAPDISYDDWRGLVRELIAEVERLQDFRSRIARILGQSEGDCDDLLVLGLDAAIKISKRQAARIEELEAIRGQFYRHINRERGRVRFAFNQSQELILARARINELEAACNKMTGALSAAGRRQDRLETAFLETEFNLLTFTEDRNESALRKMAREALEKIRSGETDEKM